MLCAHLRWEQLPNDSTAVVFVLDSRAVHATWAICEYYVLKNEIPPRTDPMLRPWLLVVPLADDSICRCMA